MRLKRIAGCSCPILLAALVAFAAHAGPKARAEAMSAKGPTDAASGKKVQVWTPPASALNASGTALAGPPNDQCAGAIAIPCGNVNLTGSTFTATNDYDFSDPPNSCTAGPAGGRDVVYSLNAVVGDSLWLDYTSTADAVMYLVRNCANVMASCSTGVDLTDVGGKESLRYKFKASGTYYLILDSYNPDSYGNWELNGQFLSCGLTPPANDICVNATKISCVPFGFSGSTQFANNDYFFANTQNCTGTLAQGRDVAYRLDVSAGDSLSAYYISSADGVLYVIGDCSAGGNLCQIGTNETGVGGQEEFHLRFPYSGTYYLIADSQGLNSFGTYNLTGSLVCGTQTPVNDQCSGATYIYCGPIDMQGSTVLATNDYSLTDAGCTGFQTLGPDVTYRIDAAPGDSLSIVYRNQQDGSAYLVRDCNDIQNTCVAGVDLNGNDQPEYLNYKFPTRGTYYLILDSYDLGVGGTWTCTGNLSCPLIAGVDDNRPRAELALRSIAPNPFVSFSTVRFSVPTRGRVTLRIYDLAGRVVRTLVDGDLEPGDHSTSWDARNDSGLRVEAGTYYARLSTIDGSALAKLIFVR